VPKLNLKPMNYFKGRREYRSKVNVTEFTSILVITCITRGLCRFRQVFFLKIVFMAFGIALVESKNSTQLRIEMSTAS